MSKQVITQVNTFKVEEICEKCGKGYMRPDPKGSIVHTMPPMYVHICTEKLCGHTGTYANQLPALVYRDHEDEKEKKTIETDDIKIDSSKIKPNEEVN